MGSGMPYRECRCRVAISSTCQREDVAADAYGGQTGSREIGVEFPARAVAAETADRQGRRQLQRPAVDRGGARVALASGDGELAVAGSERPPAPVSLPEKTVLAPLPPTLNVTGLEAVSASAMLPLPAKPPSTGEVRPPLKASLPELTVTVLFCRPVRIGQQQCPAAEHGAARVGAVRARGDVPVANR